MTNKAVFKCENCGFRDAIHVLVRRSFKAKTWRCVICHHEVTHPTRAGLDERKGITLESHQA